MLFEIIKDSVKLALIGIIILYVIQRYVRWRRPHWSESVEKHRLLILMVLGAVLLGIKLSEDAITGDSGPMDKAILLFIHKHVPAGLNSFFEALTLSGSFKFLVPLLILSSLVFAFLKKWFEAALVVASTACGGLVIYVIKAVIGRDRPTLWETRWYWGTSFPSGHTLETACVGMALALCLGDIWPERVMLFRVAALVWVSLVGFSRLVLGVHWPTDVMAAACVGLLIPIALRYVLMRVMKKAEHAKPGGS
jgi:undecaprenyl-diphosphatase